MDPTLTGEERRAVSQLTEAALQRGAAELRAHEASREPGFFSTEEVREGIAYRAMAQAEAAAREAAMHDVAYTRLLSDAPDEPVFIDREAMEGYLGRTRTQGMRVGGSPDEEVTLILDGMRIDDPVGPWDPGREEPVIHGIPGWPRPGPGPGPGDDEPTAPGDLLEGRFLEPLPCSPTPGLQPGCTTPAADVVAEDGPTPVRLEMDDPPWEARAYVPEGRARCRMVLLLHGRNSSAANVEQIAKSYALAGFRVLSLDWDAPCTVRQVCAEGVDLTEDNNDWFWCLALERSLRLLRVVDRATRALRELATNQSLQGWRDYLTEGELGWADPIWSKMIFAGYSEGANQSSFNSRFLPAAAAVFNSGGGDGARPNAESLVGVSGCAELDEDCPSIAPAAWMSLAPKVERAVAFKHVDEACDFQAGWDLNGVGGPLHDYATGDINDLADFHGAERLQRTDEVLDSNLDPHGAILEETRPMLLTNMHLVCAADGSAT